MKRLTTWLLIFASLCLACSAVPVAVAQGHDENERLLKSVFIYNFAKFTRWPENILGSEQAPLAMCTVGSDELVWELEKLHYKKIKGRPVTVQRLTNQQDPVNCHVLYVASSEQESYLDIIARVRDKPVLTVSELPDFADSGGIIKLYRQDSRIRFSINISASRTAGLEFSSRLLDLAEVVGQRVTSE